MVMKVGVEVVFKLGLFPQTQHQDSLAESFVNPTLAKLFTRLIITRDVLTLEEPACFDHEHMFFHWGVHTTS